MVGGDSRWCFTAKVKSVDGEVCTIEIDGLQLSDVRLRAVVNSNKEKILITPRKDSCVLVYGVNERFCSGIILMFRFVFSRRCSYSVFR